MPRVARVDMGEYVYHVINRAIMRLEVFKSDEDYILFEKLLESVKWGQPPFIRRSPT